MSSIQPSDSTPDGDLANPGCPGVNAKKVESASWSGAKIEAELTQRRKKGTIIPPSLPPPHSYNGHPQSPESEESLMFCHNLDVLLMLFLGQNGLNSVE